MSVLYHYTSGDALLGITSSKSVYATEINFLNDYAEYQIGINKIKEICRTNIDSCKKEGFENESRKFYEEIPTIIHNNVINRQVFVFSLTSKKDNLRQWMAYGKPNSSYSIGFRYDLLKKLGEEFNKKHGKHFVYQLREVNYDVSDVLEKQLAPQKIHNIFSESNNENKRLEAALEIANELMFECCSVKSVEFKDEKETRLIFQSKKDKTSEGEVLYREKNGIVIPYLKIPIDPCAISEIVIGPMVHTTLAKKGLEQLMKTEKLECEIKESSCTLRQF